MASAPNAFIVSLPKAELHLHLEGSIDPPTLLELKKRHGKTGTLAEVEQLYRCKDFTGFLMAFKTVTEELQTSEDYELITYRLMEKLKAENVLHAEVYISVGVCLWRKQNFDAVFVGLERGRERGDRGHVRESARLRWRLGRSSELRRAGEGAWDRPGPVRRDEPALVVTAR